MNCPECKSVMLSRGTSRQGTLKKYSCSNCGHWESIPTDKRIRKFKQKGNEASVVVRTTKQIKTLAELVIEAEIDTDLWEIKEWSCTVWEAQRANKQQHITYKKGIATGSIHDDGKATVVPLWRVTARLVYKAKEISARVMLEDLIRDMKAHAPKYTKIDYGKVRGRPNFTYEVAIPDIQFGRLTWAEESGDNYDIKIAARIVNLALEQLLAYAGGYPLREIILPIGHDFYNSDNKYETTTRGTPQQEDTRWQKTFRAGRQLLIGMIDTCLHIAPVRVIVVPGNHDEQRMFYVGDVLQAWYRKEKNVVIDNEVNLRKYYQFGDNLLGMTHGYWENLKDLPMIMASERPAWWGISRNREWHTGDKHHLKTLQFSGRASKDPMIEKDFNGCTVRQIRSLSGIDAWTFDKGFTGSPHAAAGFLWDYKYGVVGNFTANIDRKEYE